ncbi:hypothetical protein HDU97_004131 [Phlyctochytrium planicorne]|nr:hypothetical protein HDU97_004131 [Phlyctochytrium planicorne]
MQPTQTIDSATSSATSDNHLSKACTYCHQKHRSCVPTKEASANGKQFPCQLCVDSGIPCEPRLRSSGLEKDKGEKMPTKPKEEDQSSSRPSRQSRRTTLSASPAVANEVDVEADDKQVRRSRRKSEPARRIHISDNIDEEMEDEAMQAEESGKFSSHADVEEEQEQDVDELDDDDDFDEEVHTMLSNGLVVPKSFTKRERLLGDSLYGIPIKQGSKKRGRDESNLEDGRRRKKKDKSDSSKVDKVRTLLSKLGVHDASSSSLAMGLLKCLECKEFVEPFASILKGSSAADSTTGSTAASPAKASGEEVSGFALPKVATRSRTKNSDGGSHQEISGGLMSELAGIGLKNAVRCSDCGFAYHLGCLSPDETEKWMEGLDGYRCPGCRTSASRMEGKLIEGIFGVRKKVRGGNALTGNALEKSDEIGKIVEYLVRFHGMNFGSLEWIQASFVEARSPKAISAFQKSYEGISSGDAFSDLPSWRLLPKPQIIEHMRRWDEFGPIDIEEISWEADAWMEPLDILDVEFHESDSQNSQLAVAAEGQTGNDARDLDRPKTASQNIKRILVRWRGAPSEDATWEAWPPMMAGVSENLWGEMLESWRIRSQVPKLLQSSVRKVIDYQQLVQLLDQSPCLVIAPPLSSREFYLILMLNNLKQDGAIPSLPQTGLSVAAFLDPRLIKNCNAIFRRCKEIKNRLAAKFFDLILQPFAVIIESEGEERVQPTNNVAVLPRISVPAETINSNAKSLRQLLSVSMLYDASPAKAKTSYSEAFGDPCPLWLAGFLETNLNLGFNAGARWTCVRDIHKASRQPIVIVFKDIKKGEELFAIAKKDDGSIVKNCLDSSASISIEDSKQIIIASITSVLSLSPSGNRTLAFGDCAGFDLTAAWTCIQHLGAKNIWWLVTKDGVDEGFARHIAAMFFRGIQSGSSLVAPMASFDMLQNFVSDFVGGLIANRENMDVDEGEKMRNFDLLKDNVDEPAIERKRVLEALENMVAKGGVSLVVKWYIAME